MTKPAKPDKSARKSALHQEKNPSPQEINTLAALFTGRRYTEAATLAQTMTVRFPLHGFGWMILGEVFKQMGRNADALTPMQKAAALSPSDAKVLNNLGDTLKDLGRLAEAEASFRRVLEIKPNFAMAHSNLGFVLSEQGKLDEAIASYRRALSFNHDYADAYRNMGAALRNQGKLDEALACFQQLVRLEPGNSSAQHQIASLTGNNTERAPIQYVEKVFDAYADKFDTHLQQILKYDAPEKLVALVTQHSTPPAEKWKVLDLGCGTGLVGLAIAPFA